MISIKEKTAPTFLFAIHFVRFVSFPVVLSRYFLNFYCSGRVKTIKELYCFIIKMFVTNFQFKNSAEMLAYCDHFFKLLDFQD
jgi:hypothetical protein